MKIGEVSAAEMAAEPGQPIDARYVLSHRPGETYAQWKTRMAAIASAYKALRAIERSRESLIELLKDLEA
jgi:hypothetical protein